MNLKSFPASRNLENHDAGTTFVEVLVALTILSIVSIAMWTGFSASVSLTQDIPSTVDDTANLFVIEGTLQKQVARVQVPFWVYEYEPDDDSTSISLPYCDGISYKVITFEFVNDKIEITTTSTDEKRPLEPEEPKITLDGFEYADMELVYDDDIGLTGIEFALTSKKKNIGEINIYAKFESSPFWKVD